MEMELFQEILLQVFLKEEIQISFPNIKTDLKEILETESYRLLEKIKAALEDDSLDDLECYEKLEKIIRIFENIRDDTKTQ